jgi:hypothetical protein
VCKEKTGKVWTFSKFGKRKNDLYDQLKQDKEVLKGNLESGELSLDEYMGQLGSLSFSIGKHRFSQNYSDSDFIAEVEKTPDLGITVQIPKRASKKRARADDGEDDLDDRGSSKRSRNAPRIPGRMGRRPMLHPTKKNLRVPEADPRDTTEASMPENSSSLLSDSLTQHIRTHNLPVRLTPEVTPPHGNCFYEAVALLCKKQNICLRNGQPAPVDHLLLRQAVCNTLESHPQSREWIKSLFKNKRDWNTVVKNHRKPGVFTDNNGIMVVVTAHYLGVIFKIVPTSGDNRNPFYCIPDDVVNADTDGRPVLWLGLHQNETDRRFDGKAGQYQSLEPLAARSGSLSQPPSLPTGSLSQPPSLPTGSLSQPPSLPTGSLSHPSPQPTSPQSTTVTANTRPIKKIIKKNTLIIYVCERR